MKSSPYMNRPASAFWKSVVVANGEVPRELYTPKWNISRDESIATAGSCFAQHIGRHLTQNGFSVLDVEPAPMANRMPLEERRRFGYSTYSARYGNIYTTRQLLQLAQEAFGEFSPAEAVWTDERGRYFDALRPSVEPNGLSSAEEVAAHRRQHLSNVRQMLETMDIFVFTLGLTETWQHTSTQTVYPTAPGTIAGRFDPDVFSFKNLRYDEILADFLAFRDLVHSRQRQKCRFILTVSPVPLTATATTQHVMVATVHSKSILRAAAGELAGSCADVDYFPSYEIVTNPWSEMPFYDANLRTIRADGVLTVMRTFLAAHLGSSAEALNGGARPEQSVPEASTADDVMCEEILLDAFRTMTA